MKKIAIIGASKNKKKYGNIAVRAHQKQGWQVFPVNPKEKEIEGLKCYNDINEIEDQLDKVSIYLPPEIGINELDKLVDKNIPEIFINPGAESDELIKKGSDLGLNLIQACSIVSIGEQPINYLDN